MKTLFVSKFLKAIWRHSIQRENIRINSIEFQETFDYVVSENSQADQIFQTTF